MRPFSRPRLAALAAALLTAPLTVPALAAQGTPDLATVADRVFASINGTHGPGCAVGIARGGVTLLERGYGMADLAGERPITPATILESGSVAKQFMGASVMLLVADGKLGLDEPIAKHLPELPAYDRPLTVRHLLTHTSGLREWSNFVDWQGWPRGTRVHTQSDVFQLITAQRALNYPVGTHYSYTNSGFLLLRTLVERVSGQSYADFTRTRIFVPLGMTHTRWRDDYTRLVPGLAQAYRRAPDGWHLDMPNDNVIAAGGMLTTVSDWLRWNEALTNKTLGAAVTDSLTRQMRLNNGLEIQYALGLMVNRYRGTLEISHSGNTNGYSTNLARYPELGPLSIAVLCNYAGANAIGFTHQLVTALAAASLAPVPPPDTVATDHAALRAWRGLYEHGWYHTTTVLDTAGGQLRNGTQPLRALQDGSYAMDGQRVRLAVDGAGTRSIRMATGDGDSIVLTRRTESRWVPTAAELAQLAGRYRSEEIDITFTVAVDGNRLTVSPRPGVRTILRPTWRDAFDGSGESVWFTRDPKGRVTAMHFGTSRVWDFVSTRVP